MKIKGLNKEDLNYFGEWYAYHNNISKREDKAVTIGSIENGLHSYGTNKSVPVVNAYTKAMGYLHLEKMLRSCHSFDKDIYLELVDDNNSRVFTSVDKNGNDVVIDFFYGDIVDFPPVLKVLDGKTADVLLYNFKNQSKYQHEMTEEETELYNKTISNTILKIK